MKQSINLSRLEEQKSLIESSASSFQKSYEPFQDFEFSGNLQDKVKGVQLIKEGKVGCLLLAGGLGTRLGVSGPKGCFPISLIKQRSLFEIVADKVRAASKLAERELHLAIMTSSENDKETQLFFQKHHYYGLSPSQLSFFSQDNLPFLDENGDLLPEPPSKICQSPDGNGNCLPRFVDSGIKHAWSSKGISILSVILIDNPLADPFDAEFIGFHARKQAEISVKCTEKFDPAEKVGVLVEENRRVRVVEYTELSEDERQMRKEKSQQLKHCCANLSLFCFSFSFIERINDGKFTLPLHAVWKKVNCSYKDLNEQMAWKFETFIFDWLNFTTKVGVLLFPRNECFAPLKNLVGADSPIQVKKALQEADKRCIESITGLQAPDFPFELDAQFYYPTSTLLKKWRGKQIPEGFVEA